MFVRHTLELCGDGRTIGAVKDQLTRLAAADFRVLTREEGSATVTKGAFMDQFRLWSTRRDRVAEASPHTVRLSDAYFESLITRAVPLDEHAVWSLSHNALAMDLYAWLAQRLHRIEPKGGPVLVPWPRLHEQFGAGYRELFKFRQVFKATLAQVQAVYPQARWTINERGVWLHRSEPPVGRRRRRATLLRTDGRADH